MNWLSQINPNIIVPVVISLGTWIWHRLHSDKKTNQRFTISSVMETFANELLDGYKVTDGDVTAYLKKSRVYITERIWPVLEKRGIPKNSLTEALVNQLIEQWSAYIASHIRAMRTAPVPTAPLPVAVVVS